MTSHASETQCQMWWCSLDIDILLRYNHNLKRRESEKEAYWTSTPQRWCLSVAKFMRIFGSQLDSWCTIRLQQVYLYICLFRSGCSDSCAQFPSVMMSSSKADVTWFYSWTNHRRWLKFSLEEHAGTSDDSSPRISHMLWLSDPMQGYSL